MSNWLQCPNCLSWNPQGTARCFDCKEVLENALMYDDEPADESCSSIDEEKEVYNMNDEWEKVPSTGTNIWLADKTGEALIGTVADKRDGQYGPQWLIKTADGELWTPSHKVLQARMNNVPIGASVKIERVESLPPKIRGQNPTTMYEVYTKKAGA